MNAAGDSSKEVDMENGIGKSRDLESGEFLKAVADKVLENRLVTGSTTGKVVEFHHPDELKCIFDLDLGNEGCSDDDLMKVCDDVIKYSVRAGNKNFYNQLYGGVDEVGLAGAWLTEALNTSQYTFEVAPIFSLAEHKIQQKVCELIGFKPGNGIFAPGGSMSNMYAICSARYKKFPECKTKGISGLPHMVVFTSEDSHYSITKAAHWLGIGVDNVVKVGCNERGQMIAEKLEEAVKQSIEAGKAPIMVNCTSGSTVLGSYDPLRAIAAVCSKYKIWMHVDAAWGGAVIMSKKHRHLMDGIELADSMAWNPHKMLCAPLQCSMFVLKEKELLYKSNSAKATYLFQQDKFYDVSYDTGDKSIQCGRKVDAFKFWLMWKKHGIEGFEKNVDNAFDCARYIAERMRNTPGFKLVLPEFECTNVGFWYIPQSFRGRQENADWWEKLDKVAPEIKKGMILKGTLMIGYQPLKQKKNFFRLVIATLEPRTHADMDYIISEIDRLGKDLPFE